MDGKMIGPYWPPPPIPIPSVSRSLLPGANEFRTNTLLMIFYDFLMTNIKEVIDDSFENQYKSYTG